jgi:tetratricopeptide (TPR) repeat protein
MMALDEDRRDQTAIQLLAWIEKHRLWEVLDRFLAHHEQRLKEVKRTLYYVALTRATQGRGEVADELAGQAAELAPQFPLDGFWMAKELEIRNQFDWAVREYHRAIDKQPIKSHEAILARIELANLLFDREEHEAAADALEPLVKALRSGDEVSQLYAEIQRYHLRRRDLILPESESIACRYHFYRGCQYRDHQDWARARDELQAAIKFDETDADVVIAMYRISESDDKWRADTSKRIRELCRRFEQEIDQSPKDFTPYNQWAWLVANTEGDFQKAIRYSHRSIELIPPGSGDSAAASFLDTLGRCYYAAGDYKNAVKYQRQAIEKVDYMQVMHRQLALFEKALAAQREAESDKQRAGDNEEGAEGGESSSLPKS